MKACLCGWICYQMLMIIMIVIEDRKRKRNRKREHYTRKNLSNVYVCVCIYINVVSKSITPKRTHTIHHRVQARRFGRHHHIESDWAEQLANNGSPVWLEWMNELSDWSTIAISLRNWCPFDICPSFLTRWVQFAIFFLLIFMINLRRSLFPLFLLFIAIYILICRSLSSSLLFTLYTTRFFISLPNVIFIYVVFSSTIWNKIHTIRVIHYFENLLFYIYNVGENL